MLNLQLNNSQLACMMKFKKQIYLNIIAARSKNAEPKR